MPIVLLSTGANIRILPRRSSSSSAAVWKMYPRAFEYSENSIWGSSITEQSFSFYTNRNIAYFHLISRKINCSDSVILNGLNYLHLVKCSFVLWLKT
jgi:hypothetical protein